MTGQLAIPDGDDRAGWRSHRASERIDRRRVLQSAVLVGAAGLGFVGVADCGGPDTRGAGGGTDSSGSGVPDSLAGERIAPTSKIPLRGGQVFANKEVVLTQPSEGTFHAFSAICTHRGCTVDNVENGLITCPCHGSRFAITDGSVEDGPAPKPLPQYPTRVDNDEIVIES